ncbi:hypothetical protein BU25DRAFT_308039, partial [Macroventuria anomochaeta]
QPVKQSTFFDTAKTPYATAAAMVEKALSLGNNTSQSHAYYFLQQWRTRGSPI